MLDIRFPSDTNVFQGPHSPLRAHSGEYHFRVAYIRHYTTYAITALLWSTIYDPVSA